MFKDYCLMWGELRAQMEELKEKKDSIWNQNQGGVG